MTPFPHEIDDVLSTYKPGDDIIVIVADGDEVNIGSICVSHDVMLSLLRGVLEAAEQIPEGTPSHSN